MNLKVSVFMTKRQVTSNVTVKCCIILFIKFLITTDSDVEYGYTTSVLIYGIGDSGIL